MDESTKKATIEALAKSHGDSKEDMEALTKMVEDGEIFMVDLSKTEKGPKKTRCARW